MRSRAIPRCARLHGRRLRGLFALVVACVFACGLEFAARTVLPRSAIHVLSAPLTNAFNLAPPEYLRPDATLFWKLRPSLDRADASRFGDVTNSDGLRMRREIGAKDGRVRVACFGDSCTYGLWLSVDDAWPNVLDKDRALDVINAGVPGYSSYQGALLAERRCPEWKPDVVVLEFGLNDQMAWMSLDRGRVVAMTDEERAPHVRVDALLHRSVLLGWITSLTGVGPPRPVPAALLAEARASADAPDRDHAAARALLRNDPDRLTARVPPDQFRANLARMAAQAPHAIVLLWPRRKLLDPSYDDVMSVERIQPYVEAAASTASNRVDVVDLAEPLLASGMSAGDAFTDWAHGTRKFDALVADVVRAKIRARLGR
jgi:lysophospholipase L1-like esterase